MRYLRTPISALLAFLLASNAFAETARLTGDLNGRLSANFRGYANVKTTVPKGTEGEVLRRFKLPSGNTAIKIRVTTLGQGSTSLTVGEEIWVYYHQDPAIRRIELLDEEKQTVSDPEDATDARALETFDVPKEKSDTTAAANSSGKPCTNCKLSDLLNPTSQPVASDTLQQLKALQAAAAVVFPSPHKSWRDDDVAKRIPDLNARSTEEIATYIHSVRPDQKETNLQIAKAIVASVKKHSTPENPISIPFVVALMKVESTDRIKVGTNKRGKPIYEWKEFTVEAESHVGARGLMQLMPGTWASKNPYDIEDNVDAGVSYVAYLLKKYRGNERHVAGAYNCGPQCFDDYLAGKGSLPVETAGGMKKGKYVLGHMDKVMRAKATYVAFQNSRASREIVASRD